jgi:CBS domain-containing protein
MKLTGNEETTALFPVQVRSTEYADGETGEAHSVGCSLSKGSVSLEHCMNCERYVGLVFKPEGASLLRCRVPAASIEAESTPSDLGTRLRSTPVSEVMTANVTCVDSELNMDELAQVFERKHIRAAPVVDDGGVLIGMVSKSDLVRGCTHEDEDEDEEDAFDEGGHFPPNSVGVIVDGIMTTDVARLRETASLAEAARMFASKGVHHIPVVTKDEIVVGMLSVMDLARWIASQSESLSAG